MSLNVPKEKVPEIYVREVVYGQLSQNALGKRLGLSKARMSQLVHELFPLIEAVKARFAISPPAVNADKELSRLYHEANAYFLTAVETGNEDAMRKGFSMLMAVLDRLGMREKVGLGPLNLTINNVTVEMMETWGRPHLTALSRIILKYVPTSQQSDASAELDRYIHGLVVQIQAPPPLALNKPEAPDDAELH